MRRPEAVYLPMRHAGDRSDADELLLPTLRRHGLSEATALAVVRLGEELRARMVHQDIEYAAMIDMHSGAQLGPILSGEAHRVDLRPQLESMQMRRSYIQIHTHPGGLTFSPSDGEITAAHEGIQAMVAVGTNGIWYILSKAPNFVPLPPRQVAGSFTIEWQAQRPRYQIAIINGELPASALNELPHQVWQTMAPLLGLRYDRVRLEWGEDYGAEKTAAHA